jgi:AraC-like DNA-binding protein
MTRPIVLWIDLRVGNPSGELEQTLTSLCDVYRETNPGWISSSISRLRPQFLIFDYDYPEPAGLEALQETKIRFPSIPILMLTEQHSEDLAIWAFRVGVRDFLHSPPASEELAERIEMLSRIPTQRGEPQQRINPLAMQPIPAETCCVPTPKAPSNIGRAQPYIHARLGERISLNDVAGACGLTTFAFSRAFKKEHGITFQEYLVRLRIDRAQQLLANPRLSVTDVAGAAGFGDLSHFIRTFRRYVGRSPSTYRKDGYLGREQRQGGSSVN